MCKSKLVAVVGPTGSGKTELGALISQRYRGVILSADSRQVYRGLDVGTNKQGLPGFWHGATARFLGATPQLLLDLVEPGTRFTLADWLRAAGAALSEVRAQNYLPVVVGGTGLYVSALISGWTLDERKIGAPVADDYLILERTSDRTNLYDQADQRCQQIFDSLVAECRQLIERGVAASWLAHLGLDYRYACLALENPAERDQIVKQYQFATHAYIRRQLTWWRHHERVTRVETVEQGLQAVERFLANASV